MTVSTRQTPIDPSPSFQVTRAIHSWLIRQLDASGLAWFNRTLQQLSENASERLLFARFSAASRQVGKADLGLTEQDLANAHILRTGWRPGGWSVDQATRAALLLSFPASDGDRYINAIAMLLSAADVAEQIAFYQSLPLLPYPERFTVQAIDGLRSNMTAVFNAIALHNPYPADYFDEAAWNQMVLKALFVESPLSQIYGLDARANAKLAHMLSDYAHERWAAGRSVNPQLWRPVGPFAQGPLMADLERVLSSSALSERQAAALACTASSSLEAQTLLNTVPVLKQHIDNGQLTWDNLSQE